MVIELGIKMLGDREGEGIPTLPLRVLGVTLGSPVSAWGENSGVTGGWGGERTPSPHFWGAGAMSISHRGALQAGHLRGATPGLMGRCGGKMGLLTPVLGF